MTQLALPTCVLPGCRNVVPEDGRPCPECLAAFGPMLHETGHGAPLTAEQVKARDAPVLDLLAARRALTGQHAPTADDPAPDGGARAEGQPDVLDVRPASPLHPGRRPVGMPVLPGGPVTTATTARGAVRICLRCPRRYGRSLGDRSYGRGLCPACYTWARSNGVLDEWARTNQRAAEVTQDARELLASGEYPPRIAARLGMTAGAVRSALRSTGNAALGARFNAAVRAERQAAARRQVMTA